MDDIHVMEVSDAFEQPLHDLAGLFLRDCLLCGLSFPVEASQAPAVDQLHKDEVLGVVLVNLGGL